MNKNILGQRKSITFISVYTLIVVLDLICSSNESYLNYRCYTKPAILGSLILFFSLHKRNVSAFVFWTMILALIFSLLGDIFLLFTEKSSIFFIVGLIMFLLAHVTYTVIFFKKRDHQKKDWFFPLFTIIYGCGLFYVLYDGLGEMLVPVAFYMIVILIMSNTAFLRSKNVSMISYILVFIGSLFFMLSDSLLAIHMFYKKLPFDNLWIMTTYSIAQLLIVYGILKQNEPLNFEKKEL